MGLFKRRITPEHEGEAKEYRAAQALAAAEVANKKHDARIGALKEQARQDAMPRMERAKERLSKLRGFGARATAGLKRLDARGNAGGGGGVLGGFQQERTTAASSQSFISQGLMNDAKAGKKDRNRLNDFSAPSGKQLIYPPSGGLIRQSLEGKRRKK